MKGWRRSFPAWTALLLACASDPASSPPAPLAGIWREFLELPAERALAIAGDPHHGPWVVGSSAGQATREEAETEALSRCRARRASRRMQAECVLYAVGSDVVWRGR